MKRLLAAHSLSMVFFALTFCFTVCAAGFSTPAHAAVKVKISTAWPEGSACQEGALKFGELFTKATNGKFVVEVYPSDQLASGNQMNAAEMVQNGEVELDLRGVVLWAGLDDRFTVLNMPFLLPSFEKVDATFYNGPGVPALNQVARENGVIPLAWGEAGYRQISNSKREVHKPEDMKGLKFRIPGTPMFFDLFGAMGANPTTINMSEVFTALQQGVADGQENAVDTARGYNIHEVQKYLTLWNGVYDGILFASSPDFWESLSPEEQKALEECAKEAMAFQRDRCRTTVNDTHTFFKQAGMTITELTPEEIAAFRAASQPVYDKWEKKIGTDLLATFGYQK